MILLSFSPISKRSRNGRRQWGATGFSLVEVTLALGLVTFALVSIMATIPIGLSTLGDAKDQTTEAHILSGLSAQLSALTFSELQGLDASASFDSEGRPLAGADSALAVYGVRMTSVGTTYAGAPMDPGRTLRTVQILVSNLHRPTLAPNSYTVHVAKSE